MSVRVENLYFSYRRTAVLEDVAFRAEAGQLVAILGPNGSGKTTLLKTINRLLKPDRGCVWIDDIALTHMSRHELARRVGYMPQTQEGVNCTVFEAVLLGRKARITGEPRSEDLRKVEDVLRMVGIEHLAMRLTHELSGGELQKVVLGRALAQEPKVLLLDEPISHLDPVNQIEVMSLLHEVTRGTGMTSLLVTHDLNSALRFADRFILLRDGHVLVEGGKDVLTPASIKAVYGIDSFVAEVAGIPVLVPLLRDVRPHQHLHAHEHRHRDAQGHDYEHAHAHAHRHEHEVDEHVHDHPHAGEHGRHEHEHLDDAHVPGGGERARP